MKEKLVESVLKNLRSFRFIDKSPDHIGHKICLIQIKYGILDGQGG